jgi:hypothetical protein
MMLVYISCPYSAPTEEERLTNVNNAIDAGIEIMQKGHFPVIPVLMHYFDIRAAEKGIHFTWDDYMALDLELLLRCDSLLFLGHSKGADIELEYAMQNGIAVFYSIEEI